MYYTFKIDGNIAKKCGLLAAIVYAHLLIVGADTPLKDLALDLPLLTYRQIRYGISRLEKAGLIEECYARFLQNCQNDKIVKEFDKIVKRRHTARDKALLRARIRGKLSISNNLSNSITNQESINTVIISPESIDSNMGVIGGKEEEKETLTLSESEKTSETAPINEEKEAERAARTPIYREIIDYFNAETGKHYSWRTEATQKAINARLAEGHTIEDFKKVIRIKAKEWKGSAHEKYLRPETLFRPSHFESYLNQPEPVEKPKKTAQSYDADDFMEAALKRAYSEGGNG